MRAGTTFIAYFSTLTQRMIGALNEEPTFKKGLLEPMRGRSYLQVLKRRFIYVCALTTTLLFGTAFVSNAQPKDGSPPSPPKWDVHGSWQLKQANGVTVAMDLRQEGNSITGTATYSGRRDGKGTVTGVAKGDYFFAQIAWDNMDMGIYNGKVEARGEIRGTTFFGRSPSETVNWFSLSNMTRIPNANAAGNAPTPRPVAQDAPPPPRFRPIKKLSVPAKTP